MELFFTYGLTAFGLLLMGTLCGAVVGAVVQCLVVWMTYASDTTYRNMPEVNGLVRFLLIVVCAIQGGVVGSILGGLVGLTLLAVGGQILFGIPLFLLITLVGYGAMRKFRLG